MVDRRESRSKVRFWLRLGVVTIGVASVLLLANALAWDWGIIVFGIVLVGTLTGAIDMLPLLIGSHAESGTSIRESDNEADT
jgi:hypothetical protein